MQPHPNIVFGFERSMFQIYNSNPGQSVIFNYTSLSINTPLGFQISVDDLMVDEPRSTVVRTRCIIFTAAFNEQDNVFGYTCSVHSFHAFNTTDTATRLLHQHRKHRQYLDERVSVAAKASLKSPSNRGLRSFWESRIVRNRLIRYILIQDQIVRQRNTLAIPNSPPIFPRDLITAI